MAGEHHASREPVSTSLGMLSFIQGSEQMQRTGNRNQTTHLRAATVCIASVLICLLGFSCSLGLSDRTGRLQVVVGLETSLPRSSEGDVLSNVSSTLDKQIVTYELQLERLGNSPVYHERIVTIDDQGVEGDDTTLQIIFDQLPTGLWNLRIFARNADGQVIRYLPVQENTGKRVMQIEIRRGETSSANPLLVPSLAGSGTVELSIDWEQVDTDLLTQVPRMEVAITSWDLELEEPVIVVSDGYTSTGESTEDKTLSFELEQESGDASNTDALVTVSDLRAGVYTVSVALVSANETVVWQGVRLFRVMDADTVTVEFTLMDQALETGGIDLSIWQEIAALSVSFTQDSPYASDLADGSFSVIVVGSADYDTVTYEWYVNETRQEDYVDASADLHFTEAGQYTITVMVVAKDADECIVNWGVAQLEVHVSAEGGGQ